jgi:hypothetical protein
MLVDRNGPRAVPVDFFARLVDVQERFTATGVILAPVQEDRTVLQFPREKVNPAARGYYAAYRPHEVNHCPGCGRSHWLVGRLLAECAFCSTALPLLDSGMVGTGLFRRGHRHDVHETPLAA